MERKQVDSLTNGWARGPDQDQPTIIEVEQRGNVNIGAVKAVGHALRGNVFVAHKDHKKTSLVQGPNQCGGEVDVTGGDADDGNFARGSSSRLCDVTQTGNILKCGTKAENGSVRQGNFCLSDGGLSDGGSCRIFQGGNMFDEHNQVQAKKTVLQGNYVGPGNPSAGGFWD